MNFLELVESCVAESGKDTPAWIDRHKRNLNRALREIAKDRTYPFNIDYSNTFNTVAGTEEYTLTETDNQKLETVRITTDGYQRRLTPVRYDEFRATYPAVTYALNPGTPNLYYTTGRSSTNQLKLKLYPVPNAVYTIEYDYYLAPAALDSDGDVPAMPPLYHDMLIDFALWKGYQYERDTAQTAYYKALWEEKLIQLRSAYQYPETAERLNVQYEGEEVE